MSNNIFTVTVILILFTCIEACNNTTPANNNAVLHEQNAEHNTTRGEELFRQRCQACHGLGGDYRNNNAANLKVSVADSLTIVTTIINGKGAMPMFAHTFPDSDLAQLALYVKTLRKR